MNYTEADVQKVQNDPDKLIEIARSGKSSYEIARLALALAWGQTTESVKDEDIRAVRSPRSDPWPPQGMRV